MAELDPSNFALHETSLPPVVGSKEKEAPNLSHVVDVL